MKLCKDCKHYASIGHCRAPQNMKISPVTGDVLVKGFIFAETHREEPGSGFISCRINGTCGREGRWWERRKTLQEAWVAPNEGIRAANAAKKDVTGGEK